MHQLKLEERLKTIRIKHNSQEQHLFDSILKFNEDLQHLHRLKCKNNEYKQWKNIKT